MRNKQIKISESTFAALKKKNKSNIMYLIQLLKSQHVTELKLKQCPLKATEYQSKMSVLPITQFHYNNHNMYLQNAYTKY